MRTILLLTTLLLLFPTTSDAGHRSSGLAPWASGSMPPISGGWGQSNYYGAGGLRYGHPSNRVYGSTPPLYGWVLYQDAWGNLYWQWGPVR